MIRIVVLFSITLALTACTTLNLSDYIDQGDAVAYSSTRHPPIRAADVRLYYSDIPQNYKIIGKVIADNDNMIGIPRSPLSVAAELRSQSAKLGANAVIDISANSKHTTGKAVMVE